MYEGVRICCRCQLGIPPGEPYDEHTHDRPSSAPLILFSHKGGICKRQPHQGAPARPRTP